MKEKHTNENLKDVLKKFKAEESFVES